MAAREITTQLLTCSVDLYSLIIAACNAVERMRPGELGGYYAERLELAAKVIREKALEYALQHPPRNAKPIDFYSPDNTTLYSPDEVGKVIGTIIENKPEPPHQNTPDYLTKAPCGCMVMKGNRCQVCGDP